MRKFLSSITLIVFASTVYAQNGITWNSMDMDIANNSYDNMHPRIVMDGSGNPLVVWGRMSDEAVFLAKWNGTTFSTPVKLNPSWLTVATASWMGPDIAAKGDTVYVVVKRTPETSDTNHIYILSSFNGGASFAQPTRVDFIADSISRFPTVDIDAMGNPLVAFMKFNSTFLDSRWVVTKSANYGVTFSLDVKASGHSGPTAEVCDCCPGALISNGSNTTMLYRDNLSNMRDIWSGVSTDNSVSFPTGFAVDNNNWMISSCPSSGPDGVIVGDTLYSVFMSSGSGNYRTYLSKFSVANNSLVSVSNLTGSISGLGQQNYPRIASDGSAMAIVWKQSVSGAAQLPILFTNDISSGLSADYDTVDLANITNADVAIKDGKIFVVWQDDAAGTVKFRSGTYTPLGTNVDETEKPAFKIFPNPATDVLNIVAVNGESYTVTLFNALGQQAYTQNASANSQLLISQLPQGIYSLRINQGGHSFTQTIIKQ